MHKGFHTLISVHHANIYRHIQYHIKYYRRPLINGYANRDDKKFISVTLTIFYIDLTLFKHCYSYLHSQLFSLQ